jgi:hypothetical protein
MMISDCMPSQRALSIAARSVATSFSVGMITDTLVRSLNSASIQKDRTAPNVIFTKFMPALDHTSTWSDMNFRASA